MIVTINENNSDKYLELFTEAQKFLSEEGYVDNDKERISNLAEYYGHMADFFEKSKYKYVMLPVDEDPFLIDLNERKITVPGTFSKCASIQSDQLAETIIFVVDRYFDYMDLANTNIFVQWTTPEDKKNGIIAHEGATRVEMVDLETLPSKIKFAWPLNDEITKTPGTVKFSVRFFRVDDNSPNEILYSLNTTEASFIIKPALQPVLNSKAEEPIGSELFAKAIVNSLYTDEGVDPPVMPEFREPGSYISSSTGLLEIGEVKITSLKNNTVTLYAQAMVTDTGDITYKWYYKEKDGEPKDCEYYEPETFDEDGNVLTWTSFGIVKDAFIEINPKPTERVRNERYYVSAGDGAYELYTGSFPTEETLYERYTSFTVPPEGKVTGEYYATAYNNITLTNGKVLTTINGRPSDTCLLPGPSEILFKVNGNLTDGVILVPSETDDGIIYQTTLQVDLVADDYEPEISYEWRRSTVNPEDVLDDNTVPIVDADTSIIVADQVGWYSAKVISLLNREITSKYSNICKVTKSPEPPVVETQDVKGVLFKITEDTSITFSMSADVDNPNEYNKNLLTDEVDAEGNINSFDYIWQYAGPETDNNYVTIKDNTIGVSGLHTNSITFDYNYECNAVTVRCLIINNLNGEKAVFDHSGLGGFEASLGAFENKAPHIYENENDSFVFTLVKF